MVIVTPGQCPFLGNINPDVDSTNRNYFALLICLYVSPVHFSNIELNTSSELTKPLLLTNEVGNFNVTRGDLFMISKSMLVCIVFLFHVRTDKGVA